MNPTPLTAPEYPYKPIGTLSALESALGVPLAALSSLANKANHLYRTVKAELKSDGTLRQTFDAFPELKGVQTLIKDRLLKRVLFPEYLTGSLKGRDYRSNAKIHAGAAVIVCEDVTNFFPSVSENIVRKIWMQFFGFSPEVSDLLTRLTTKDGSLPQGSVTSSYLANLAFFEDEPRLYIRFASKGHRYSRYVDDVNVSSKTELGSTELSAIISEVYTMLGKNGFKAKRRKHEIKRRHGQMFSTKLLINGRVALTPDERGAIRAAVYQLERKLAISPDVAVLRKEFNSIRGRVDKLKGFHPTEGKRLRQRIDSMKHLFSPPAKPLAELSFITYPKQAGPSSPPADDQPPW